MCCPEQCELCRKLDIRCKVVLPDEKYPEVHTLSDEQIDRLFALEEKKQGIA